MTTLRTASLLLAALFSTIFIRAAAAEESGWTDLLNGRDLSGWMVKCRTWASSQPVDVLPVPFIWVRRRLQRPHIAVSRTGA